MVRCYKYCLPRSWWLVHKADRFGMNVIQLLPGDNLNVLCTFVDKACMQHLSEKSQFLSFMFRKVVQKH